MPEGSIRRQHILQPKWYTSRKTDPQQKQFQAAHPTQQMALVALEWQK